MKKSKHHSRSTVPQFAANQPAKSYFLNKDVAKMKGWKDEKNPKVLVSIRFVQYETQCFSDWSKEEMKHFWEFQEKLSNYDWPTVHKSGGKPGEKVGLGYTPIEASRYPDSEFKKTLSQDITLFELRVTQKIRVHGFRDDTIFYICWLDKDHAFFPV